MICSAGQAVIGTPRADVHECRSMLAFKTCICYSLSAEACASQHVAVRNGMLADIEFCTACSARAPATSGLGFFGLIFTKKVNGCKCPAVCNGKESLSLACCCFLVTMYLGCGYHPASTSFFFVTYGDDHM